jgi:hypothetical protein
MQFTQPRSNVASATTTISVLVLIAALNGCATAPAEDPRAAFVKPQVN